jgi:putative exosortase-associated protein (TIGR04073 family)
MAKKLLSLCIMAVFMVSMLEPAYAVAPDNVWSGMGQKFGRGVVNTLTGWLEIPFQITKGYKRGFAGQEKRKIMGVTAGIFTGVWHAAGRTISGVADIAGFWAADPRDNELIGIPLEGDRAWQEGTEYSLTKPDLKEAAAMPMTNKLMRGIGNAIFGVAELPGQMIKGMNAESLDLGLVKGLWYFMSREIDGVYEIASFPLPNPKDNKGMPFDEKWPWSALGENL